MVRTKRAELAESTPLDLRGRRVEQGLTLEQIAESTKISIRFLRAIEAEDFGQLPGGIFNTSYLKQYALATGFDEGRLLSHYEGQAAPDAAVERPSTRGLLRWLRVAATAGR